MRWRKYADDNAVRCAVLAVVGLVGGVVFAAEGNPRAALWILACAAILAGCAYVFWRQGK